MRGSYEGFFGRDRFVKYGASKPRLFGARSGLVEDHGVEAVADEEA